MALNKISSLRRHVKIGIMNKRLFTIGGFDIPALLFVVVTTHVLGVLSGIVPALAIGFGTKQPEKESVRTDDIRSLKEMVSLNDPINDSVCTNKTLYFIYPPLYNWYTCASRSSHSLLTLSFECRIPRLRKTLQP